MKKDNDLDINGKIYSKHQYIGYDLTLDAALKATNSWEKTMIYIMAKCIWTII
jgi:hypothetical protein